jgi:hypothetical protein
MEENKSSKHQTVENIAVVVGRIKKKKIIEDMLEKVCVE